jgi:hypothetical protein
MKPAIVGVISHRMCLRRTQKNKTQEQAPLEAAFLPPPKVKAENVVLIIQGGDSECVRQKEGGGIKELLLSRRPQELDTIKGVRIPPGCFHGLQFPLRPPSLRVSVLPALFYADSGLVSWSVYSRDYQQTYALEASMSYVDFLLHHCVQELGITGRIDYTLLIYSNPFLFGQATLTSGREAVYSFCFARVLCCRDVAMLMGLARP